MRGLIAVQVAFCFVVTLMAGLFVATFERLSSQPTGFAVDRVLTLETVARQDEPPALWEQILDHLRSIQGVESAGLCGWPLMSGNVWTSDVWVGGRPPERISPYFLSVSPGWLRTMRIPLLDGRDFRPDDVFPTVAMVNEAFARHYFGGENPVGRSFEQKQEDKVTVTRIVGYVRDARYRDMRSPIRPTVYVPYASNDHQGGPRSQAWGTFVLRTARDPLTLAGRLRLEVPRARSEFRVLNVRTQRELVDQHTARERLLAALSSFFGLLALVLAAIGLYGVLHYSVVQRRRELGIRMALGARPRHVAGSVSTEVFTMFVLGASAGVAAGIASERYVRTLLYEVKATDLGVLLWPALVIVVAALSAAVPPLLRAVRIDPALTLRSE
jgi:predicted permease